MPNTIRKTQVKQALAKYGIFFGFPCNARTGETVTCWDDHYSRNGDTVKLKAAIVADEACPFTVSNIPANYMSSIRLVIRPAYTCPVCGESFCKDAEFALMEYCPECGRAIED